VLLLLLTEKARLHHMFKSNSQMLPYWQTWKGHRLGTSLSARHFIFPSLHLSSTCLECLLPVHFYMVLGPLPCSLFTASSVTSACLCGVPCRWCWRQTPTWLSTFYFMASWWQGARLKATGCSTPFSSRYVSAVHSLSPQALDTCRQLSWCPAGFKQSRGAPWHSNRPRTPATHLLQL